MITITLQLTPEEARVWAYVLTQLSNDALSRMFRPRHWRLLADPAQLHDQETAWRVLRMLQLALAEGRFGKGD
jgi:hypothetical protein